MSWIVTFLAPPERLDALLDQCWQLDTTGVAASSEPAGERVNAGFSTKLAADDAVSALASAGVTATAQPYVVDWPPPEDTMISVAGVEVAIRSQRAFGHGNHPTTRLLLDWLGETVDRPNLRVLDIGTGTGVLAITAAKLGAHATGIDNDPDALLAARHNIAANQVDVEIYDEGYRFDSSRFDVVVANMLLSDLRPVAPLLLPQRRVDDQWRLAVAGLLNEQVDEAISLFVPLQLLEHRCAGDWAALVFGAPLNDRKP